MLHSELEKIDSEVQTSLENLDVQSRESFEAELTKLREDKSLLEGRIRGYLTLSDICKEYKEELAKLREDYDKLLKKVHSRNSNNMESQHARSESPSPADNDLGTVKGREKELRTSHNPAHHSFLSNSINNVGPIASNILKDKELPVRTKDLFDVVEDPPKSSEGTKSMPKSIDSTYRDKYPMQESLAFESSSSSSVTGLGFDQVSANDQSHGHAAYGYGRQQSDLIGFSISQSFTNQVVPVIKNDEDLENVLKSVQPHSDKSELKKVVETVKNYANAQNEKLQRANSVLVEENNQHSKTIKQLEEDNKRLIQKLRSLEKKVYDLSNTPSRSTSMSPEGSSQAAGWVHVQKAPNETVTKTTETNQKQQTDYEGIENLQKQNEQLREANHRWSNEWNKLQAHFDTRIADLQLERDKMAKELTDIRISEDTKQRDYEKMLMNAKKKAGEEENAKEEALLLVTSANNRAQALQQQLAESEDTNTALRREKQVLETELSVIRQRTLNSPADTAESPRPGRTQAEWQIENDVLRQQLLVFQEDFDRERQDRAKAQSLKDDYKKQNEQYKKRLRHIEQKNLTLDRQLKTAEDAKKRLESEKQALHQDYTSLRTQLQREQERMRNLVANQVAYQPVIQPAAIQPQRQVIFGQEVHHPRPQQYVIQPTYEQRLPQLNGTMVGYMSPPQAVQQGVVNPPAPYYQANQPGKQTEYKVGSWACNQCTYMNYPGRTVCEVCGYIQSPSASTAQGNFVYRQNGNETLHARGEPPPFGYGGAPVQNRNIPTNN